MNEQTRRVAYIIQMAIAFALEITSFILAFIWFGWQLVVVLFLFEWSINIYTRTKNSL